MATSDAIEDEEKVDYSYTAGVNVNWYSHCKNFLEISYETTTLYWAASAASNKFW